jgi:hypothetical protein
VHVGGEHGVEGDRADAGEGAADRVEADGSTRPATVASGSTASLRCPHIPHTRVPGETGPAGVPGASSTTSPTSL